MGEDYRKRQAALVAERIKSRTSSSPPR